LWDRLELVAFEAEPAHLPRSLVAAIWNVLDSFPHSGKPAISRVREPFPCGINPEG
jgi:hypothetical protein